jgi:hypothetical protein
MSVAFQDVLQNTVSAGYVIAILLAIVFGGVISTLTYTGNKHWSFGIIATMEAANALAPP